MSISIDDLVSSFSSSHIGQEANDLAALQAQLAEVLFAASSSFASTSRLATSPMSISFSQHHRGSGEPCTTPTARSPVASGFNWGDMSLSSDSGYRSRSSSISTRGPNGYDHSSLDVEDEMMVEELLVPCEASTSMSVFESPSSHFIQRPTPSSSSASHSYQRTPTTTSSTFATSDPFYLQAQANAQSYFYENSNFTKNGQPSLSSPFVAAANNEYHPHRAMELASGF